MDDTYRFIRCPVLPRRLGVLEAVRTCKLQPNLRAKLTSQSSPQLLTSLLRVLHSCTSYCRKTHLEIVLVVLASSIEYNRPNGYEPEYAGN